MNIIQYFLENKINFAVCIARNQLLEYSSSDYCIIVKNADIAKIKKTHNFKVSKQYRNITEINLKSAEIDFFKLHANRFKKVLQNKFGKIYELKSKSFKKTLNNNL